MIADGTEPGTSSDDERSARDAVGDARQRTLRRTEALERSVAEIVEAAQLTSTDDEHDPEGATIAYERAQASASLRRARTDLDLLDDAARRLDEGGGTACPRCGRPIGVARVLALPTTRTCVGCAP